MTLNLRVNKKVIFTNISALNKEESNIIKSSILRATSYQSDVLYFYTELYTYDWLDSDLKRSTDV